MRSSCDSAAQYTASNLSSSQLNTSYGSRLGMLLDLLSQDMSPAPRSNPDTT